MFLANLLMNVGDIHIRRKVVKVRFRIDGILQTVAKFPLMNIKFSRQHKILERFCFEVRSKVWTAASRKL